MEFIADILLVAGTLGAGTYCFVLAQRLKRFNDLEKGVGGAVAVMSAQVDDMTKTLSAARATSGQSSEALEELTGRAEAVAQRLELMIASLHDLPKPQTDLPNPSIHNGAQTQAAQEVGTEHASPEAPVFFRHARTGAEDV